MDNLGNLTQFYRNNIKADMPLPVFAVNIFFSSIVDPSALELGHKTFRLAKSIGTSGLHLNKNSPIFPLNDQVNFSALTAIISGYNPKSFLYQKFCGQIFTLASGFDFIGHVNVIPL